MCLYCVCGDQFGQLHPAPWPSYPLPYTSLPMGPVWPYGDLSEAAHILERLKRLEDRIGCGCDKEESKPDYIGIIRDALKQIEKERGFS